jgi:uncharacterized protein
MSRAPDKPLDALALAAASAVVERSYALARLTLHSAGGVPAGELSVTADAVLTCQRCLGPLRRTLESSSRLAFVAREDAPVPADHEAIAGDPERVDLAALVEDELLLSLPLIATHRAGEECLVPELPLARDADAAALTQERRRPFAGLKDLLKH